MLKVRLFGRLCFHCDDVQVMGLEQRKAQELLCYLLITRDHPHPRESLATLLWPESDLSSARRNLRQVIWHLQSFLDAIENDVACRLLLLEGDWIRLHPQANVWLDVAEFECAFNNTRGMRGWELDEDRIHALQNAMELYRGDLMEGWYSDWCLFERERMRNMYSLMLDKLMGFCEANHEYDAGVAYGNMILRHDRAHERTHRRLMRLHYLYGDRTMALRQYNQLKKSLHEELGVAPCKRTKDLYLQICAEEAEPPRSLESQDFAQVDPGISNVIECLRRLRISLSDLQGRVQHNIMTIDETLNGQK